jgi:superoxide dismutase, Fe-Mn family
MQNNFLNQVEAILDNTVVLEAKKGDYTAIKLPYALNALEPYIDKETMNRHYNKHYKTYLKKLNDLMGKRRPPLKELVSDIKGKNDKIRFNAGGAYNHEIFWQMLTPDKKKMGKLEELINKEFGSFDKFKDEFEEQATTILGSGWCWLVTKGNKLEIVTTPNQDNPLMDNMGTPVLGIDMWEHAYYLKHGPEKKGWVKDFFKVVNWDYCNAIVA